MCGIAGKLSFDPAEAVTHAEVHRMCETLVHRGPDAEGIHVGPGIGLGQRRLSIIDLSDAANPPLASDDGTLWIVFNGEIYNFRELRADLAGRGHRFRTDSDTEVLLRLYQEDGERCLDKLHGMFAFAVWNARSRCLFAARDRLGKKPLVYARTARAFLFGSEIKAVLAVAGIEKAPNYAALDAYLTWQYVPSPLTAFAGVHKLPAAHYLRCDSTGKLEITRYWSPPDGPKTEASSGQLEEELVSLLRDCVRARMVADVPLGALLSGGIDSGTVVALMAGESTRPVKTFSIGFEEEQFDELPFARLVAQRYGTEHHEFVVRPSAVDTLPELVRHYGEPFADSSAIPMWYVSRMTRKHVTVALTGDGGDESFAGYTRYGQMLAWNRFDAVPEAVRRPMRACVGGLFARAPYSNPGARIQRGLEMALSTLPSRYDLMMSVLKPAEREALYTAEFKHLAGVAAAPAADRRDPPTDALDWMMRHDQGHYLPDCLMVKADIAAMANSLELRAPFLDHRMVEFAARIPSRLKRDGESGKTILRSAVRNLLPADILAKRKTGFGVPLGKWLREDLAPLLDALLLDERCARRKLFEPAFLRRMVDEHRRGTRDWSNRLWALMFLEAWFREFID